MNPSFVVTGASGFLGAAVIRELAKSGRAVRAVSRAPVTPVQGVELCPVTDYGMAPAGDILIHLAEARDKGMVEKQGERHVAESLTLIRRLLAKGYGRFIYASTATVYGDGEDSPRLPDHPTVADSLYTRGKLACEGEVLAAGGVVARLTNIYGPGMANNSVLAEILTQIPGQGPLEVRDAEVVRDFLWIGDAARGLVHLAEAEETGLYNIASGRGCSVGDVARRALSIAGQGNRPIVSKTPTHRRSCLVLDISRTVRAIGWSPKTSLDDGLARLLQGKR